MPLLPPPSPPPQAEDDRDRDRDRVFVFTHSFGDPPAPADYAYFLRMLDRDLPPDYIQGLKTSGGYELLRGEAAVGARLALMAARWDAATLVGYASPGQKASGWVYLSRATAAAGRGTVKAGTVVGTLDRRLFRTQKDVLFDTNDLGPFPVEVEALLPGYEYNVDGEQPVAFGDAIPGLINTVYLLLEDPDFFDPTIAVRNPGPMQGGQDPQLEQLAIDRGAAPRQHNESLDAFRLRIKSLIRGVSPRDIEEAVTTYIRRWSPFLSVTIIDSWDWQYQTGYDCRIPDAPNFPSTIFVYDDPRPPAPRNRWLSAEGANGGEMILNFPEIPCLADQGFCLGDPATDPADFLSPMTDGGRRGYSCLDLPEVLPAEVLPAVLGGPDAVLDGVYAGAVQLANDLRAGGTRLQPLIGTLP